MENFSIFTVIENQLTARNKKDIEPAEVWWASDTLKCHRKRYWKRQGLRGKPLTLPVLRQLSLGGTVHDWAENLVKGHPSIIGIEVKTAWVPGNVRGRCDLVYKYAFDDGVVSGVVYGICDIKSVHPYVFKLISKNRYNPKQKFVMFDEEDDSRTTLEIDVMDDRVKVEASQVALYKLGLDNSETFPGITFTEGRLVYVSRADLGMIEIPFKFDDYTPRVIEDYQKLNAAWEQQKLPSVLELNKAGEVSKECKYCEFLPKCKDELKEKKTAWKSEDSIGTVRRLIV